MGVCEKTDSHTEETNCGFICSPSVLPCTAPLWGRCARMPEEAQPVPAQHSRRTFAPYRCPAKRRSRPWGRLFRRRGRQCRIICQHQAVRLEKAARRTDGHAFAAVDAALKCQDDSSRGFSGEDSAKGFLPGIGLNIVLIQAGHLAGLTAGAF